MVSEMRHQGKIVQWKDEQGFGFVVRNGSKDKVFVHISAFSSRSRRPVDGDLITYEPGVDGKQRTRAEKIHFADEESPSSKPPHGSLFGPAFAALFFLCLVVVIWMGRLPTLILAIYACLSSIAFIVYALDKSAAQNQRWRIQESTLHCLSLLGGWPGAALAQQWLRHKSKKQSFQWVYKVTVLINCAALGWLFTRDGSAFLGVLSRISTAL